MMSRAMQKKFGQLKVAPLGRAEELTYYFDNTPRGIEKKTWIVD
jgi:hypothetical protein